MNIEQMSVGDITPYFNNPRKNNEAVDVVVTSIEEFGFQVPIIVDKDMIIIAGHTRWEAAKKLGMDIVPVIVASELSDVKAKAFRIMDNKAAEASKWDFAKLLGEIDSLEELDCNMDSLGFDMLEIEKMRLDFEPRSPRDRYEMEDDEGEDRDRPPFDPSSYNPTGSSSYSSEEPEGRKNGTPVIQYTIIFNTDDEQSLWYGYLRSLKVKFPEATTIAERLIEDIKERDDTL